MTTASYTDGRVIILQCSSSIRAVAALSLSFSFYELLDYRVEKCSESETTATSLYLITPDCGFRSVECFSNIPLWYVLSVPRLRAPARTNPRGNVRKANRASQIVMVKRT